MTYIPQPGASRQGLKTAAVAGGGLALGAAAAAIVLAAAVPGPAPVDATQRVVLSLRAAPDPTAPVAMAVVAPLKPVSTAPAVRPARKGELDCLTQAVYFEARGETASGQAAVAQVVMNRVRHPAFPKTVCGVVYQGAKSRGCQFSFACDGWAEVPRESSAWRRSREVAARALVGMVAPQVAGATHFHNAGVAPGWGSRLMRVAQVGLHVFYRFGPPVNGGSRPAPEPVHLARLDTSEETAEALADPRPAEAAEVTAPAPDPAPQAASADAMGADAGEP